jgi:hypothetical protein
MPAMTLTHLLVTFLVLAALLTGAVAFDGFTVADALIERLAAVCYPAVDPFVRWLL